uniref:Sulfotransferase domain-containing protein n=1 Tax=Megaviridae environmental sample TaxID=1737588 RepID=A0A5J6VJZ7_9VIRU|nr:MAG: hypothetical protein [Megaviridae environmental sample]
MLCQIIIFLSLIFFYLIIANQKETFSNQLNKKDVRFIHVGKTGGSTLGGCFKFKQWHCTKPKFNKNEKYIISIRNPLKLFVSNINNEKKVVQALDHYNNTKEVLDIPAHERLKSLINKNIKYSFSKDIHNFLKINSLDQICINIKNIDKKYLVGHTLKNISWYLNNGKFIEKYHKNIVYVTKQETLNDDIKNIAKMLNMNINLDKRKDKRVNNNKDDYLSPLAIKNLKDFFKDTEYKTLQTLYNYGFINKEYLDYCYTYNI